MKILRNVCAVIVGAVFIFSGFVKGVDPAGFAIKLEDYFFAFQISFLNPLAVPLAILVSAVELIVGIGLVFKLFYRQAVWGALLFMLVFLPLTLILALTNPVSDCGCFGDAIIMTNWQTFFKNLLISALLLPVFFQRKEAAASRLSDGLIALAFLLLFVGFSLLNHACLPVIDFRPYCVGANIPEKMSIPEGAPMDEYEISLIYEKNGVQQEFTLENYPWEDSTWVFVDQKSELISKGYTPPIHDFNILSNTGEDITDLLLHQEGYTFLLISSELQKADKEALGQANRLAMAANMHGHSFQALTASGDDEIVQVTSELALVFPFYFVDETTLKTIVRSNPGLLLLNRGTILAKWPASRIPDTTLLEGNLLAETLTGLRKHQRKHIAVISILGLLFLGGAAVLIKKKT